MNSPPPIHAPEFNPKKSVALCGVVAGHTAICTVGDRSGHQRRTAD